MTRPLPQRDNRTRRASYGKLFPDLPPLEAGPGQLSRLGRLGGPCDLGIASGASNDARGDAVWPIFGQFIAHDITADRSPIDRPRHSNEITNFRAPRANLESVFGPGPVDAPYLYERADPAKLLLAASGLDVPRNHEGIALIGDARNDSHILISQMHVAFAKLHNRVVDHLRHAGVDESDVFEQARRSTIWHYQHIILREFLPRVIGSSLASELREDGPRFFDVSADEPGLPSEFAAAAYRYGHAQIRQHYRVNTHFGPVPLFPDLVGFGPVDPEHAVDWSLHIGASAQRAKRIDMRLPRTLIELPAEVSGASPESEYSSLAARDLARGPIAGLASGEAIARAMGITPLDAEAIGLAQLGWRYETPLWLYVLKEAEALCDGERLGPVAGRIVGEVLVGIIDNDRESFRALERDWQPWLGADGSFSLADVLLAEQRIPPAVPRPAHDRQASRCAATSELRWRPGGSEHEPRRVILNQ
ncbi:MAG: peroxidase family protein [Gaiellaceae bacterium]